MLKLEINRKKRASIAVKMSDQNRFLNKTFLQALTIAIALHAMGAIIFHVQIFKIIGSEKIPSPVKVESLLTDMALVGANINEKPKKFFWLRKPRSPDPKIPEFPNSTPERGMELTIKGSREIDLFSSIERLDDRYLPQHFDLPPPSKKFTVVCSGGLERKTVTFSTNEIPNLINENTARYQVRVEDQSGEMIWFEPEKKAQDPHFASFAENFLKTLKFANEPNGAISSGWIEISYHGEQS